MKNKLKQIIANMRKYNSGVMYKEMFGFDEIEYDALVLAPAWKPTKIIKDTSFKVTSLAQHSNLSGFLVEKDALRIAWAQTASGACNLLDSMVILAEVKFKTCIFIGAVGGLTREFEIGDFCTPVECISAVYASKYLEDKLSAFKPFESVFPAKEDLESLRKIANENGYELKCAKVFSTDSISLEYSHLDEIKATGAELIEMETSTFYKVAPLLEVPSFALLVISDNSATGVELLGRNDFYQEQYHKSRCEIIPDMIYKIAKSYKNK